MVKNIIDLEYQELLLRVLVNGEVRQNRTGVKTVSTFGESLKIDVSKYFPLLTTKKIQFNSVIEELRWFLSGETNVKSLQDNGVHIWDNWADENGEVGKIYGYQWRKANGIDQLQTLIDTIKTDPNNRRLLASAWNIEDLGDMALPPCHYSFQFYVSNKNKTLNLLWNQRSVDAFLGLPFNIASYALLLHLVANLTGKKPGMLIGNFGDTHIYLNHLNQVKEQICRRPYNSPKLQIASLKDIDSFTSENIVWKTPYKFKSYLPAPIAI
jgi:thymidylate synthase